MLDSFINFLETTGVARLFASADWWKTAIMFVIAGVLIYLAIVKQFEPLLLLPIAVGMLLTNLPGAGLFHLDMFIPPEEAVGALELIFNNKALDDASVKILCDANLLYGNALTPEALQAFAAGGFAEDVYHDLMKTITSVDFGHVLHSGGLLDLLYLGVKLGIYPSLIFMGIGAMTDFSPLISNPKSFLIGAGAQLGVFVAFSV